MIEVVGGVPRHADALHHPAGAQVAGGGEGDDLAQAQTAEAVLDARLRAASVA